MIVSAIVAKAANNIIGKDNTLPWHLPSDLKWFKQKTSGHHVIMGRKSFESLGRPLPNRTNIVVTANTQFFHSKCVIVRSIDEALKYAHNHGEEEVFILGGGQVYHQTRNLWDRLYLTEVNAVVEGDTYFPEIDLKDYNLTFQEFHSADDKHQFPFTFKVYQRERCKE